MAGERIKLDVLPRERNGSAESRRLRAQGFVPGVLYGDGKQPHAIAVAERDLRRVLTGPSGLHAILDVTLEGTSTAHPSILKDYQRDPIRGRLLHIDLQEVRLDKPIQATVSVHLVGEAQGAKEGGVLSQVNREIRVEALPLEVPEHIELDVSALQIGEALRIADLAAIEGVTFLDDPEETVLATVTLPTRVEEPEEMVAEGEELEVPEGEEAPEGAAEAPAEPEADAGTGPEGEPGTTEG